MMSNLPKSMACCHTTVRDKTKWEWDLFRTVYTDLERRQADGETYLIVSYVVNGIPKAIKRPSKN